MSSSKPRSVPTLGGSSSRSGCSWTFHSFHNSVKLCDLLMCVMFHLFRWRWRTRSRWSRLTTTSGSLSFLAIICMKMRLWDAFRNVESLKTWRPCAVCLRLLQMVRDDGFFWFLTTQITFFSICDSVRGSSAFTILFLFSQITTHIWFYLFWGVYFVIEHCLHLGFKNI